MSQQSKLGDVSSSCVVMDYNRTFLQKLCARVLQRGPMPRHIAIVMDGNRRYARAHGLTGAAAGHEVGNIAAKQTMKMFLDLGIKELTLYSFSEDNFKRTPEEVRAIMKLTMEQTSRALSEDGQKQYEDLGIQWNIIGNWDKIPSRKLKNMFAKLCVLTRKYNTLKFNVAFAYSSQAEMCNGILNVVDGLSTGGFSTDVVNEKLLKDFIYLDYYYPVDIVIRTGGDHRLSDFLLWQASSAHLEFVDVTWPEFSHWDLLRAIFHYQYQVLFEGLPRAETKEGLVKSTGNIQRTGNPLLETLRKQKWEFIESLAK